MERTYHLRRGHLAAADNDDTPGAIHWFQGIYNIDVIMMSLIVESGMWDFYSFDPPPEDIDPVL